MSRDSTALNHFRRPPFASRARDGVAAGRKVVVVEDDDDDEKRSGQVAHRGVLMAIATSIYGDCETR